MDDTATKNSRTEQVCSDRECKAKLQVQAEAVESLIKERDKATHQLQKLRSDISAEVHTLYRQVVTEGLGNSSYDPSDWHDQLRMVR
jgi:hypothetical protein